MKLKSRVWQLVIIISILNSAAFANTDTTGMHFEHLPSWKDVLAKAKKENKLVFLDCYTTWCGPCKMMASKIFIQKEVGDFYNAKFINTKVQLDTTDNDDEYTKSWYKEGSELKEKHNVRAFPTYLIFNGDGEIVHRFVGSMPAADFIKAGQDIQKPENQYYTQLKKYENGDKSPVLLLSLIKLSKQAYDDEKTEAFTKEYMATQKDIFTKDNLGLLYDNTKKSTDKGFLVALNDGEKADKILEKPGFSRKLAKKIILQEELNAFLKQKGANLDSFDNRMKEKYPNYAKEVSNYARVYYNRRTRNWGEFVKYADEVVKTGELESSQINNFARTLFENTSDKVLLERAAAWSKISLAEDENNPSLIHTYANILYKAGKVNEALAEEKRALNLAQKTGGDTKWFESSIDKMQKGEPTWPVKK